MTGEIAGAAPCAQNLFPMQRCLGESVLGAWPVHKQIERDRLCTLFGEIANGIWRGMTSEGAGRRTLFYSDEISLSVRHYRAASARAPRLALTPFAENEKREDCRCETETRQ
jgi:hypothetical protein